MNHGTNAAYVAGCRCDPCRIATRRYHKALQLDHHRGIRRRVDSTGVRRRIEALGALGWTGVQIGALLGTTGEHVRQLRAEKRWSSHRTAARVAAVYEELRDQAPPETSRVERHNASRQRNQAKAKGWAPPEAWHDIDDPTEQPWSRTAITCGYVDEVVVERILVGDPLPANRAERREVIRRWPATGRPLNDLERLTGWNVARELRRIRQTDDMEVSA